MGAGETRFVTMTFFPQTAALHLLCQRSWFYSSRYALHQNQVFPVKDVGNISTFSFILIQE
jgi:hypothetical protein